MYNRVLVKIGTNLIVDANSVRNSFLESFVAQISEAHKNGTEFIIVTSGAIGSSLHLLGFKEKPQTLEEKQAAAAVGQIVLMQEYKLRFNSKNIKIAQVLLTHDVVNNEEMNKNAYNTLNQLLVWRIIPIINENDTVATEEIKFGDNDILAGIIGAMMKVDLAIILTSVDGIFDKNPENHEDAVFIEKITEIDTALKNIKTDDKTSLGSGGIESKLKTAKILQLCKIPLIIANGNKENIITKILAGKKEGTRIE